MTTTQEDFLRILPAAAIFAIVATSASAYSLQLKKCSDFSPRILALGDQLNEVIDQATDLSISSGVETRHINAISGSSITIDDELAKIVKSMHDMCAAIAEAE